VLTPLLTRFWAGALIEVDALTVDSTNERFYSDQNIWSALDLGCAGAAAQLADTSLAAHMSRTAMGYASRQ
jgi:hypothetical protein